MIELARKEPCHRPGYNRDFRALFSHPWFQGVEWGAVAAKSAVPPEPLSSYRRDCVVEVYTSPLRAPGGAPTPTHPATLETGASLSLSLSLLAHFDFKFSSAASAFRLLSLPHLQPVICGNACAMVIVPQLLFVGRMADDDDGKVLPLKCCGGMATVDARLTEVRAMRGRG